MEFSMNKIYTWVLEISVVAMTFALVWFAFVYYPKIANQYKTGAVLPKKTVYAPVYAQSTGFPIETEAYRIVYEQKSQTYYVVVAGGKLDEYIFNRDNAKLALKSALSLENLCSFNVVYASASRLEIPEKFKDPGC